jgi:hypothetical protein
MDWTLPALKILLTGILFMVVSGICILLVTRIQRALAVQHQREHTIKLSNQGNFTSIFALSVGSAEQMFNFTFLSNGIPLIAAPPVETLPATSIDSATTPDPAPVPSRMENPSTRASLKLDGVTNSGQAVAAKSGQAAAFLSTLASLLPGSLGSGLRAQSEALRQTQTKVQTAARAPKTTQRKLESLKQQSGRLVKAAPTAPGGKPLKTDQPVATPVQPRTIEAYSTGVKQVERDPYTAQTPPVEPGGSLSLTLRVEAPKRSRLAGTYAYTLSSRQLPMDSLDGEESPVTTQGILYFPKVDFWRYWLAPVTSVLMIAISMLTFVSMFRFIWR